MTDSPFTVVASATAVETATGEVDLIPDVVVTTLIDGSDPAEVSNTWILVEGHPDFDPEQWYLIGRTDGRAIPGITGGHAAADTLINTFGLAEVNYDPTPCRSYVVGLPVTMTVYGDGRVTYQVDLSEAGDLRETQDFSSDPYDDDAVEEDAAVIDEATRRLQFGWTPAHAL